MIYCTQCIKSNQIKIKCSNSSQHPQPIHPNSLEYPIVWFHSKNLVEKQKEITRSVRSLFGFYYIN